MEHQEKRTFLNESFNDTPKSQTDSTNSSDENMSEKSTIALEQVEKGIDKMHELLEHQKQIKLISCYILITVISSLCIALIVGFIVVPVVFAHWVYIQRLAMFTNVGLPSDHAYYDTIDKYPKLIFQNFYINFTDSDDKKISLGVWHLLAYKLYPNETKPSTIIDLNQALQNNSADVVIYFHGSGECRRDPLMMYNVLLRFFHVIAFDYRDYGDSTPAILSETAIARDAVHVFQWVRTRTKRRIYVWGHSLGTPLSTLTLNNLPNDLLPHGLILESPMISMDEEIAMHPYGKLFAWLPWFVQTIKNPLKRNGFLFTTDKYILNVTCPIMILHAEDDSIIPCVLGRKLAEIAANQRPNNFGNVTYVQFSKKYKYNHFRIYRSKRLLTLLPNFTVICDEYYNKTHGNSGASNVHVTLPPLPFDEGHKE